MMTSPSQPRLIDQDLLIRLFDTGNNLIQEFRCTHKEYRTDMEGKLIGIAYGNDGIVKESIWFGPAVAYIRVMYAPNQNPKTE